MTSERHQPVPERGSADAAPPVAAEQRGRVGLARLASADGLNVLTLELRESLAELLEAWDADPGIGCIVIAGGARTFAAGADIESMRDQTLDEAMTTPSARLWPRLAAIRTPLVAAVSGHALGGGCELALACDMIVASRTAVFGQPEIRLGIIPGGGATQRLTRAIGKHRAMELVLTGRRFGAEEAHSVGLVTRLADEEAWLDEALALAETIARRPPVAVRLAKESVLAADELPLSAALRHERRLYELSMATDDRREGMAAFLEKRTPDFAGR